MLSWTVAKTSVVKTSVVKTSAHSDREMDFYRELTRRQSPTEQLEVTVFAVAALYAIIKGTTHTVLLGLAVVLMILGALPRQVALGFLLGASAILLVQTAFSGSEGFEDKAHTAGKTKEKEAEVDEKKEADEKESVGPSDEEKKEEEKKAEAFNDGRSGKPMVPDHRERRELLELGKPYKLPSESDDKGFHLDAGTTFLNAYKALKPDQISAMTKDTQELLATQKSLMGMLDSFGPLLKDMNKITGILGSGPSN